MTARRRRENRRSISAVGKEGYWIGGKNDIHCSKLGCRLSRLIKGE
jgi:hypothetical protein